MLRWENYFMKSGSNFESFWKKYQEESKPDILFIMGMGFDPRTNNGIESIYSFKSEQKRDTILLRYYKSAEDVEEAPVLKVKEHLDRLTNFLNKAGYSGPQEKNIILRSDDDKSIASINATYIIPDFSVFEKYSDIVIDISAMPRGIFIPLINKCLDLVDQYNNVNVIKKNLHVIVSENSNLDGLIMDKGTDEAATYIYGFRIKEIDKTVDQKEVWIPLLGENQTNQFDKIKVELNPVEICPILPFPCENLRRGDNLIIEYQDRLLNDNNVELKNIVYADESNPFQVYRLLNGTIHRYNESFRLLSGCKIIVSALSSKLLTIGAFMAVYEKKKEGSNIGIMHVESMGHELSEDFEEQKIEIAKHNKLFEIWLAGIPYNEA
ncbi:hypothetical protein [Agriterribacter sp.]|uniref:hypothetical protein n=1 Tax=Agriterribacter sp. TaxID=2821509 RepID=UPI002BD863E3|nr:hypothetical protein [Agriterribacter sp.]HTN07598.1 hypothetical protein [Agriterribacter sp.]